MLAAIRGGYEQLGFSDHGPWHYKDGFVSGMRMPLSQFPDYLASIRALRNTYKSQIAIYIGLESEYYKDKAAWLRETRDREGLDYLILGNHFDQPDEGLYFGYCTGPDQLQRYARNAIQGMESGLYQALAHPDLFMAGYPVFDADCLAISRDICQAAAATGVLLEYNVSGFFNPWFKGQGYPAPLFWEQAALSGARAIIGIDAHDPSRLLDQEVYDKAAGTLASLGIPRADSLIK